MILVLGNGVVRVMLESGWLLCEILRMRCVCVVLMMMGVGKVVVIDVSML